MHMKLYALKKKIKKNVALAILVHIKVLVDHITKQQKKSINAA